MHKDAWMLFYKEKILKSSKMLIYKVLIKLHKIGMQKINLIDDIYNIKISKVKVQ